MAKAEMKKETMPKTEVKPVPRNEMRDNRMNPLMRMRQLTDEMEKMMFNFGFGNRFNPTFLRNDFLFPTFGWFDETPFLTENEELMTEWTPQVEVFRRDNQFVVRADLPGLKKDEVKVEIDRNQLTIEGERKMETEEKKEDFYRTERVYGTFYRAIPLPEGAKTDAAKATFKDGVLEVLIEVPKLPEAGRRLEITEAK